MSHATRIHAVFIAVILAIAESALFAAPAPQAPSPAPRAEKSASSVTASDLALRRAYGSRQAPITVEIFSDYQCPACKAFFEGPFQQLKRDYIATGKVYFVHHDYPLPIHMHSRDAAHWADAAAAVGLFPQVETALFGTQDDWGPTGKIDEALAKSFSPAEMARLRAAQTEADLAIVAAMRADIQKGTANEVDKTGTPGILVDHNGHTTKLPSGVPNYSLLKSYLDSLLQAR